MIDKTPYSSLLRPVLDKRKLEMVDLPSLALEKSSAVQTGFIIINKQAFSLQHTQLQQLFICCVSAPPSKPASFIGDGSERTYGTVTRQVVQGVCSVVFTTE